MQITINITPEIEQDTVDAFCSAYHYQVEIEQVGEKGETEFIPNPQSKESFMWERIAQFVKDIYVSGKVNQKAKENLAVMEAAKVEAEGISCGKETPK